MRSKHMIQDPKIGIVIDTAVCISHPICGAQSVSPGNSTHVLCEQLVDIVHDPLAHFGLIFTVGQSREQNVQKLSDFFLKRRCQECAAKRCISESSRKYHKCSRQETSGRHGYGHSTPQRVHRLSKVQILLLFKKKLNMTNTYL